MHTCSCVCHDVLAVYKCALQVLNCGVSKITLYNQGHDTSKLNNQEGGMSHSKVRCSLPVLFGYGLNGRKGLSGLDIHSTIVLADPEQLLC